MKKILIIGAGFLQDFVICKAKKMGYEVYAVDGNRNAVGFAHADHYEVIDIVDEEACLTYARNNQIDGVLTAATDYGVLTAAYIAQEMDLPGLKYEIAKLIKNKYKIRKCLFDNNVDDTDQAFEVQFDTNFDELANILKFPVMIKPCDGSGSRGASRVDSPKELKPACEKAIAGSIIHRAEIESFIIGKEYGAEALVLNGEVYVLGVMQKWMTKPPYYAELGHSIPNDLNHELEIKVRTYVTNTIEALCVNYGCINVDLIVTDEGNIHIIDVGARMGGNMIGPCIIPYGTGIDYMAAMIQNAMGDEVNLNVGHKTAVATKLLAFDEGLVKYLPDMKKVEKKYDVEIYHHLEIGMKVNEYHTNLDGCGYIVARGDTQESAVKKTEAALEYIKETIFL